ncbi:MAG: hypothetical protein J5803_02780 [Desulfovibrio sp.]|nr:hypothetical protein [Desulfovibrio sp.]
MLSLMDRPLFSLFICPDAELALQHAASLFTSFAPEGGKWEKRTYWGEDEPSSAFWDQFCMIGLFESYHALIVHQAEKWSRRTWEKLDKTVQNVSSYCWPIFLLEVPWQANTPKLPAHIAKSSTFTLAEKMGWIWRHKGLTEATIKNYVLQRVTEKALPIPERILRHMTPFLPPNARAINNELDKLALLYEHNEEDTNDSKTVSPSEGSSLCAIPGYEHEFDTFLCIRHIEEGKLEKVFADIKGQKDTAKIFFVLLTMLDRELKTFWQIKTHQRPSIAPTILSLKTEQARRFSLELLAKAMTILVDAEWSVKSGRNDIPEALDILLITLTSLFAGQIRAE